LVLREKTIGAIEVINKWGGRFTEDDLTLLNSIAASVAIAIENARLYAEVKDFADELARSQAQLIQSEKLAATGKLAASIAHELNNPLQAVQSCVYLVADQTDPDNPNRKYYLGIAREELGRMARIVGQMVDFYRPSGEGRIPTDVNALLENVVALVRKRLQQGGIEVDLELAPDLPLIVATGDHLKQVFLNMIINALEAMPQGGRLEMATRHVSERGHGKKASADSFVEIEFADTGVGIPAEHINNIFDPFFTTKSKGMGLGLSVSYGIVERHRGQIQVDSKVGEGTTFIVRLPVEGGR
jgi:two-component system NtrC family sensor kinase